MKRVTTGRTVNVTRAVTKASVQAPSGLPRKSRCQTSRQPTIRSLPGPRLAANLTGFRGLRLCVALVDASHAEVPELAGERVAPPPEQPRSLLPMALRALEGRTDEHPLELWLRGIQERRLTRERMPLGPAPECRGPVRRRARGGHG